jgi:hypothetical protein
MPVLVQGSRSCADAANGINKMSVAMTVPRRVRIFFTLLVREVVDVYGRQTAKAELQDDYFPRYSISQRSFTVTLHNHVMLPSSSVLSLEQAEVTVLLSVTIPTQDEFAQFCAVWVASEIARSRSVSLAEPKPEVYVTIVLSC